MRDVVWSDDALQDFEQAISYVARESARAAFLIADRLEIAVGRLADMPSGRHGRVKGTYEKLVWRPPTFSSTPCPTIP